jgi:urease accessory protein
LNPSPLLPLLHLCDSLFPLGGFAHSEGLETATSRGAVADVATLRAWMTVCADETIGRTDGPAIWQAWPAFRDAQWETLSLIDEELTALRPSSSARRASTAIGARLLTTWQVLHPDPRLDRALELSRAGVLGPALPVAFAGACACAGVDRRQTIEAFAYTRLAATVSTAMRSMPIGQTDAHGLLAEMLDRVPAIVDAIALRDGPVESFAPAVDIATMTQQYLHSRLFRS